MVYDTAIGTIKKEGLRKLSFLSIVVALVASEGLLLILGVKPIIWISISAAVELLTAIVIFIGWLTLYVGTHRKISNKIFTEEVERWKVVIKMRRRKKIYDKVFLIAFAIITTAELIVFGLFEAELRWILNVFVDIDLLFYTLIKDMYNMDEYALEETEYCNLLKRVSEKSK